MFQYFFKKCRDIHQIEMSLRIKKIIIQRENLKEQALKMRRSLNLEKRVNEIFLDYEKSIS